MSLYHLDACFVNVKKLDERNRPSVHERNRPSVHPEKLDERNRPSVHVQVPPSTDKQGQMPLPVRTEKVSI